MTDLDNSKNQSKTSLSSEKLTLLGVFALSFFATFLAFLPSLGSQFLLDEQFVAAWTKALFSGTAEGGWGTYFSWRGPDAQDAFGPLASIACLFFSAAGATMSRLLSITVHAACSTALYSVTRKLTGELDHQISAVLSATAALIFAVHPLSAELINFSGAIGIELSVLFFALSFNFYLVAHPFVCKVRTDIKRNSIFAILFFICSCLAYAKSWYLIKIVAIFEILNFALDPVARAQYKALFKSEQKAEGKSFFLTLATLIVASLIGLGIEFARGMDPVGSILAMMPQGFKSMFLSAFLPVNRAVWKKSSGEYIVFYILFALASILSAYGAFRSPRYRVAVVTAISWVFFGLLIGGNQSIVSDDFYGHRFLAHAQAGICILFPMLCFGLASALSQKRVLAMIPAVVVSLIFAITLSRHSFNQSNFYKASGKLLEKIQKSAAIVCAREQTEYCVAKDLPRQIAVVPCISPFRPAVLDGKTGLLRSPVISGGPLKDALVAGKLHGSTTKWDGTFNALVPVVLEPKKNEKPVSLDAKQIAQFLNPPLDYWKTVKLLPQEDILKVESNSEHEPGISLFAGALSPLDGDAFYVDARISTPVDPANPNVELHWMTQSTSNYEKEDRRTLMRAQINDKTFHRYMLSLRRPGWIMNGAPTQLTIGFPSSSSVDLKAVGIENDTNTFAKCLPIFSQEKTNQNIKRFANLCSNFPNSKDLGLCHLDKDTQELTLTYDVSAITGSASCVLFACQPEQLKLLQDAGSVPDDSVFKINLSGTAGQTKLELNKFAKTGIYAVRLSALDSTGKTIGNYSDTIWLSASR